MKHLIKTFDFTKISSFWYTLLWVYGLTTIFFLGFIFVTGFGIIFLVDKWSLIMNIIFIGSIAWACLHIILSGVATVPEDSAYALGLIQLASTVFVGVIFLLYFIIFNYYDFVKINTEILNKLMNLDKNQILVALSPLAIGILIWVAHRYYSNQQGIVTFPMVKHSIVVVVFILGVVWGAFLKLQPFPVNVKMYGGDSVKAQPVISSRYGIVFYFPDDRTTFIPWGQIVKIDSLSQSIK